MRWEPRRGSTRAGEQVPAQPHGGGQCGRAYEAADHGPRREAVVAVTNGRLDFGPWEQIFYREFDGRRRKQVLVKIIGE